MKYPLKILKSPNVSGQAAALVGGGAIFRVLIIILLTSCINNYVLFDYFCQVINIDNKVSAGTIINVTRDGASPSGKAPGFGPGIRRFESFRPSHFFAL